MKAIALTLPIAPSKIEAWRRFCQELSGSRLWLYVASRRTLGVTHESLVLVETLAGSSVVMSLDSGDIDVTVEKIVASRFPFDTWYRERVVWAVFSYSVIAVFLVALALSAYVSNVAVERAQGGVTQFALLG